MGGNARAGHNPKPDPLPLAVDQRAYSNYQIGGKPQRVSDSNRALPMGHSVEYPRDVENRPPEPRDRRNAGSILPDVNQDDLRKGHGGSEYTDEVDDLVE